MRILVVEDDVRLARVLERGLREEGFVVESEVAGDAGLSRLRAGGFDLCILDVELPKMDGFVVLESARRAGIALPILMLTARDAVDDRVRGLELGADDYLPKPFAFAELLARLRALLRRNVPQQMGTLRARDLELDPAAHRVCRRGEPLALSQKQFAILEFLLRHPGQVVTRAMILGRVFGQAFDPGTNVIDVHVAQLRRKIDRAGEPSLIEAVRGVGYRMGGDAAG